MRTPRVLFWDLETLPLICTSWGIYKPFLTKDNILTDFTICCGAWKFLGGKAHVASVSPGAPRNDKALCAELRDVLVGADVVVHHNGDAFDIPMLNTRLIKHGLQPLPPLNTVDTKKVAFRNFRFSCAKLDYLAKYLDVGRKIPTSFDLWLGVMGGDAKALAKMRHYNVGDVRLLEAVYLKLRAFDNRHPNGNVVTGAGGSCPVCGSSALQRRGYRCTRTRQYRQLQCQNCGAWSREVRSVAGAGVVTA